LTDPYGLTPWFHPYYLETESGRLDVWGLVPEQVPDEEKLPSHWFLLHPDMVPHQDLNTFTVRRCDDLKVLPTSSGRTVQILGSASRDYIKFHYDGLIGRIDRKLPLIKAISGPEVSQLLLDAIEKSVLPKNVCILHETGAKLLRINPHDPLDQWGLVWREGNPRGERASKIRYLLPLFSLWSVDRLRPFDPPILKALCQRWGTKASAHVIHDVLLPIMDTYFSLVSKLGLQMEFNSQNILLGFDENWYPLVLTLRDMMGTEKDLTLRESLGLSVEFDSSPYKCISAESDQELYRIRHSFVFDFKVGTYVLDPIINCASSIGCLAKSEVISTLRLRAQGWLNQLPSDYFPADGCWYRHDLVLLNVDRRYFAQPTPRYR
jgi:hypothetical protein